MAPITRAVRHQTCRTRSSWPATGGSDALYQQAFAALTKAPGAQAIYDRHRERGATHHQALRALANRLVGILHGCRTHCTPYDEAVASSTSEQVAA